MFEDALVEAFKNLNGTALGSVLVLVLVAFFYSMRIMRQDIKELREELKREQEAHQKTRDGQLADLRNLVHIAKSVDDMRTALVDYSLTRGGR